MARFVHVLAIGATIIVCRVASAGADEAPNKQSDQPGAAATDPQVADRPAQSEAASKTPSWRYRWHNGRWWYWTVDNRWLYWSPPQGWVAHQAVVSRAPAGDQWRWGWDPANPFDRYPPGRPINSPRMFPKNM